MIGFFEPREMPRFFEARGMFGCTSRTVSYAWELISVSMGYSQGDEFNTSLSRFMYCTHAFFLGLVYGCLTYLLVCGYLP